MASDSSSPTTNPSSSFAVPVLEKLTKTNYRLWHTQVLPGVRAAQLEDILLSIKKMPEKTITIKNGDSVTSMANPEFIKWCTRDRALLSYLLSSLTREVLMGVTSHTSSAAVWAALEEMFSSHTHAQTVNLRIALATTKKGTMTMAGFFSEMRNYADDMAASGQSLGDEEFITYVLTGLDEEIYNPFVSSIVMRVEPISPFELFS
jgi:hypothetical protein